MIGNEFPRRLMVTWIVIGEETTDSASSRVHFSQTDVTLVHSTEASLLRRHWKAIAHSRGESQISSQVIHGKARFPQLSLITIMKHFNCTFDFD